MRELNGEQKERLTRLCRRLLRVLDPQEREAADEDSDTDAPDVDDEADAISEPAGVAVAQAAPAE